MPFPAYISPLSFHTGISSDGSSYKKKIKRKELPADICIFCENETDTYYTCNSCQFKCFATCTKCRGMGAPSIRAPRRMVNVRSLRNGKIVKYKLCYPHCARKKAYQCQNCSYWVNKSNIEGAIRREGNIRRCLCKTCAEDNGETVCVVCHRIMEKTEEYRNKKGYLCHHCFKVRCMPSYNGKD